ncbi:MAG: hypothetical protein AAF727_01260 [Pseudomonadota bacterium]
MFRSCRYVLSGLVAAAALHAAPMADAQGIEIAPIGFDVADEGDALVLAAFASTDASPVFGDVQVGATPAAARVAVGLPQPSIIIGLIAPGQEDEFGLESLLPGTVEELGFSLDDLAAREALRDSDPDLFARLVQEGHLDLASAELPRALQTELARMNCYRSRIDGDWGRGSRRSVGEYFDQLASVDWPDQAPTNDLLRAILLNGDVACPTPVAAAPRTPTPSSSARANPPRQAAPQPAPAPAPAAKPKRTLSGGGLGIGALR